MATHFRQKSYQQIPHYPSQTIPPLQFSNKTKQQTQQQCSQKSQPLCDNEEASCYKFCFFVGNNRKRQRRKTQSNLQDNVGLRKQDREMQNYNKRQLTERIYGKMGNNLSPKISLSKANQNIQQMHKNHHRKKIYTEHDNTPNQNRPSYYQCATDRTPNSSYKNYPSEKKRVMGDGKFSDDRAMGFRKKDNKWCDETNKKQSLEKIYQFKMKQEESRKQELNIRKQQLEEQIIGLDSQINQMELRYNKKIGELQKIKKQLLAQLNMIESPKYEGKRYFS